MDGGWSKPVEGVNVLQMRHRQHQGAGSWRGARYARGARGLSRSPVDRNWVYFNPVGHGRGLLKKRTAQPENMKTCSVLGVAYLDLDGQKEEAGTGQWSCRRMRP